MAPSRISKLQELKSSARAESSKYIVGNLIQQLVLFKFGNQSLVDAGRTSRSSTLELNPSEQTTLMLYCTPSIGDPNQTDPDSVTSVTPDNNGNTFSRPDLVYPTPHDKTKGDNSELAKNKDHDSEEYDSEINRERYTGELNQCIDSVLPKVVAKLIELQKSVDMAAISGRANGVQRQWRKYRKAVAVLEERFQQFD